MKIYEGRTTTYEVDGCEEPCYEVTDGHTMVRLAPCYHYFGQTTTLVTEYLDGEFNSQEELDRDWDSLEVEDVVQIALYYSAYLR